MHPKLQVRSLAIVTSALLSFLTFPSSQAQEFPSFTSPSVLQSTQYTPSYAVSNASVPNGAYGTVVLSSYADAARYNEVGVAVTSDGQDYIFYQDFDNLPQVGCDQGTPQRCGVSVANFGGKIYITYADTSYNLNIALLTPITNNVGYTASLIQTFSNSQIVSAPAMSQFGNQLVIIYPSSADASTKNAFFEVTCSTPGGQCVSRGESQLGASALRVSSVNTPGLAPLNGYLWLCSQQNNSNHTLFVYKSADGVNWQFVENVTSLALGGGAQMVTYKNNLVLANPQNSSRHDLFIFSSPDGVNWSIREYTGIQFGAAPGLATNGNSITLSYKGNDNSRFYSSSASN